MSTQPNSEAYLDLQLIRFKLKKQGATGYRAPQHPAKALVRLGQTLAQLIQTPGEVKTDPSEAKPDPGTAKPDPW